MTDEVLVWLSVWTVAPPEFCNRGGAVRYGSIGSLEYEVPQSQLYCLCINVALCSTALQCMSCDTKKFHDNECTHILHNFWTSTHTGGSFPLAAPLCLERGADCLHTVQLMPLHPKTPQSLASFKSRLVLPFWYRAYPGCPGKEAVKRAQ